MSLPFYALDRITPEDRDFLTKYNQILKTTTGISMNIDYLEQRVNYVTDIRQTAALLEKIGQATNAVEKYSKIQKKVDSVALKAKKVRLDIALVGITNAGKSTTLNALCGIVIAPDSNSACTAIPTIFVYNSELKDPFLEIPKSLIQLTLKQLHELRKLIAKQGVEDINMQLQEHPKAQNHIPDIISGELDKYFNSIPTVTEEIHNYLTKLNDLYRICRILNIGQLPVKQDYPIVNTPFHGITENIQGTISIIDMPGPNEANQSQSQQKICGYNQLLEKTLSLTQKTILVADYSDMGTEAFAAIIAVSKKIIHIQQKDNLLVLVNKIDQRENKNDLTPEDVKLEFQNALGIDSSQIIEVSSRKALSSAGSRRELKNFSSLSSLKNKDLVKKLAKTFYADYGATWLETKTTTKQDIAHLADTVWEQSGFTPFIEKIGILVKNAEYETLRSASEITQTYLDEAVKDIQDSKNQLQKNHHLTGQSIIKLEKEIDQTQNNQKIILNQWLTSLVENNQTLLFSNFKSKDFDNKKDADSYLAESIAKILENFSKIWDDNLPSLIKNLQVEQNKLIQLTKANGLELQFISVEGKLPQPTFSFKKLDPECKIREDKVPVQIPIYKEIDVYEDRPIPHRRTRHYEPGPDHNTYYQRVKTGTQKVVDHYITGTTTAYKTMYCIADLHKYQIFDEIKKQIRDFINSKDTISFLSLDGLRKQLEGHKVALERQFKANVTNLNFLEIETQQAINLLKANQQRFFRK